MDNNENNEPREDTNETNDAREEGNANDENSNAQNVEENQQQDYDATEQRFSSIEATLNKILGQISSIREAQGVMVENGAVIQEDEPTLDFTDADSFVPPAELDLLV